LNDFTEEVYVEQLLSFVDPTHPDFVFKLDNSVQKTRYITRYNLLYNLAPTNRYVKGLKNTMLHNYSYFAHNVRYVTLLT